jgi:membrane protein implicated in regulation of membrane protease activity
MTWANFYLVCFAVGLAFSLISFFASGVRLHLHLPHLPHAMHGPIAHAPVAPGHAGTVKGGARGQAGHVSPFNFVSFAAFLAWFGGTGYLLTRFWTVWFAMGLAIALLSGLTGAGVIYLFLSKVLMSEEENLDPADYEMTGVLGRTSVSIRQGGTGEIIYSQAGTRKTCGARAEDSTAIEKGSEVIVIRYEKGIAYVRRWTEMAGEEPQADSAAKN